MAADLEKVVLDALDSEDPNLLRAACYLAGEMGLERAERGLIKALGHKAWQVQAEAARALGRIGSKGALPFLRRLLKASEGDLRQKVLAAAGAKPGAGDDSEETRPEVLRLVGLYRRRRDLVREFSRGMQQRLAIGRAVLHRPQVLLFDEPHTGLDQDAAAMLDTLLREIAAGGRTVVMTSHDLLRAARLADRVDILSRGAIAASVPGGNVDPVQLSELYRSVTHD